MGKYTNINDKILIAFRNGIINNTTGIGINDANIFMNNGGNDIYNSPSSGYYVRLSFDFGIYYVHATYNYWGTPHIEEIEPYLDPSSLIIIDPICTVPQSPYVPSGDEKTEIKFIQKSLLNNKTRSGSGKQKSSFIRKFFCFAIWTISNRKILLI